MLNASYKKTSAMFKLNFKIFGTNNVTWSEVVI